MQDFLFLFRGGNVPLSPEESQAHMQRWMQWMGDLGKEGKFVGAQPLNKTGKQVKGTSKVISDGPFMEGKEMVGGYLICKAGSYEEALEISKGCPILEFDSGIVEVREIAELKM
ncbi:MAG: YciI family protein [Ginsengibacter sp.]